MTYQYKKDGETFTISDEQIIEEYFNKWSETQKARGKEDRINHENCIADFVIDLYAWEYKEDGERS